MFIIVIAAGFVILAIVCWFVFNMALGGVVIASAFRRPGKGSGVAAPVKARASQEAARARAIAEARERLGE